MMRALIIAFSTYSRIPMPRVEFKEKSMRYCMCFFPVVGMVIGIIEALSGYGLLELDGLSMLFAAGILTVLPILLTGGIHMDGYFDTIDARHSYKSKEEKLEILKDPHLGAFAVIYGIAYFVLYYAVVCQLLTNAYGEINTWKLCVEITAIFVLERILSGISVVTFPKAKKSGMLATTADAAEKKVKAILITEGLAVAIAAILVCPVYGATIVLIQAFMFVYYRIMSTKEFGGITGDLAGYFLQLTELASLLGLAVIQIL